MAEKAGQKRISGTKARCYADLVDISDADDVAGVARVPSGLLSLPFNPEGLPEDIAPIAEVFSWLVSSRLADKTGLPLMDRDHLTAILKEWELGLSETSAEIPDGRIFNAGRISGAGYMLSGAIHPAGDEVRITARVFDTETTRIAASATHTGAIESLEDVAEALGQDLAAQLDIEPAPDSTRPADLRPMANLNYMRGMIAYYNGAYPEAIEFFMKALSEDSK